MTRDEIENLTLRMGENLHKWFDAEQVGSHYILVVVDKIDGELATALTSSNSNPQQVATMLENIATDMLSPSPETELKFLPPPKAQG